MIRKPIPYGRQEITDADVAAVTEALKSDYLTQGPRISEFERAFAEYVDAGYAVAVNNATAGLHLAVKAMGIEPGDRVIVTPMTFASSANCVRFCGGEVTFCDIDPRTYLMDIDKLRALLESHPQGTFKGVIPVDFAGYPQDMEQLRRLADEYGLWIVEDACHAPGGSFVDSFGVGQRCGNCCYADAAVFSFHPVKHIATGEGGMVTTRDEEVYERLMLYRTHGITKNPDQLTRNDGGWYYEMQELGFNYRLTDIQAALGLSQLSRADMGIARRREIAERYDEAFSGVEGITIPYRTANAGHAFHLYVIQVDDRKGLYDYLREAGIYAQVHYVPLNTMPYYRERYPEAPELPVVEEYYRHCLSLPMFPSLTDEEQDYVIAKVKEFLKR